MHSPRDSRLRRAIRRGALGLAAAGAFWAAWLIIVGGIDAKLFGVRISSNNPRRMLLIAAVALVVGLVTGGDDAVIRWLRRGQWFVIRKWVASAPFRRWLIRNGYAGRLDDAAAIALALTVTTVGIAYGSRAVGGSDCYGYVSEAELFLHGRISVPQPWVKDVPWPNARASFAPLGYIPTRQPATFTLFGFRPAFDQWAIVPTYSPGLPLLMAGAKFVAGNDALFWVVGISGGVLVLSTYLIGRRLGCRRAGLAAAFLVATSPPFMIFLMVTMSDVPVAAALALACWCILGRTMRSAAGAALAMAAVILIRPNLAPLIPVLALWLVIRVVRRAPARWFHAWRGVVILGGCALGLMATSAFYWFMYGTPAQSGYDSLANYFAASHVWPNIRNYTQWFALAQTPFAYLGLAALFVPAKWLWPDVRDRAELPVFGLMVLVVFAEYCYFLVFNDDSYLRFFLCVYPFIMIGLAGVALAVARIEWRGARWLAAAAVLLLVVRGFNYASAGLVFQQWNGEAKYLDVAEQVQRHTPENSVVISVIHSGNVRYVAGRVTLRWDILPADWLDRGVEWMAAHGVRTYALLDDWERVEMRRLFAGQKLLDVLEARPVFQFGNKFLYDFGAPPGAVKTEVIPVLDLPMRSVPPVPAPALMWK